MNLLIVDDYLTNRKVLRAALEAEGHAVREACNGLEALRILASNGADAVISDVLMPTMDGFRFCREVRKRSGMASVPIILYTSTYNSVADRELADSVGADAYLQKPAPIETILGAVNEARLRARNGTASSGGEPDDSDVLERYNAVLVRKLESRNAELQEALGDLRLAHEQILELNRNLETRVAQRTAALDAVNRELEAFSYSVSHDLRAPLRHINGFAQLLSDTSTDSQMQDEARGFVRQILDSSRRMDRLITDLLAFAHSARTPLEVGDVDLEVVLEEALRLVRPETQGRNIEWRRVRLPTVRGDARLLRQVFVNLLSNAIKYTGRRELAIIEIGQRAGRADEIVFFVRDNGAGFDSRRTGELFGVFKRLHSSQEFEGTGIGLANANRIVTRHGGVMWAEASIDRGATFSFSLPRATTALP